MSENTNEPENNPQVSIKLDDLAFVVRLIDIVTERGAFKGTELSAVGAVRDKIADFVAKVSPQPTTETTETKEPVKVNTEISEVVPSKPVVKKRPVAMNDKEDPKKK